jgi:hypothetical protein
MYAARRDHGSERDGRRRHNQLWPAWVCHLHARYRAASPTPSPADADKSGSLKIHNKITIVGNGPENTIIDGNQTDRVFLILNSPTPSPSPSPTKVSISGVTIQHGKNGNVAGGIFNAADPTLTSVTIANNTVNGLND